MYLGMQVLGTFNKNACGMREFSLECVFILPFPTQSAYSVFQRARKFDTYSSNEQPNPDVSLGTVPPNRPIVLFLPIKSVVAKSVWY